MKKLILVPALFAAHYALASKAEVFTSLDIDKDGFISEKEAESNPILNKSFANLDTDQNGQLGWSEFSVVKLKEKVDSDAASIEDGEKKKAL